MPNYTREMTNQEKSDEMMEFMLNAIFYTFIITMILKALGANL